MCKPLSTVGFLPNTHPQQQEETLEEETHPPQPPAKASYTRHKGRPTVTGSACDALGVHPFLLNRDSSTSYGSCAYQSTVFY
jgi:hypothetical protein